MVKDLGFKKYEFKNEQPTKSQTFFDFDNTDDSPFYDDVHQLKSIDIIEEDNNMLYYSMNTFQNQLLDQMNSHLMQ